MRPNRLSITIIFLFVFLIAKAQEAPSEVKYKIWDTHALRYYPSQTFSADSIVLKAMNVYSEKNEEKNKPLIQNTISLDFVINKEFADNQIAHSTAAKDFLYKWVLKSYGPWLQHARPIKEDNKDLSLSLLLSQELRDGKVFVDDEYEGIFDFPGQENVSRLLTDLLGDIDVFKPRNEMYFLNIIGPLAPGKQDVYKYFVIDTEDVEGQECYKIGFYSKNLRENAAEGFLYINKYSYYLEKAVFSLNYNLSLNFGKDVLLVHHYNNNQVEKKGVRVLFGNDVEGGALINQNKEYDFARERQSLSKAVLTPAQQQIGQTTELSRDTRAYKNVENVFSLLLTNRMGIGHHNRFQLGHVSQIVSYNNMEGLRLRFDPEITTKKLKDRFLLTGYVAYGFKDRSWKYRGDVLYSFTKKGSLWSFPKSLLTISYVDDLNLPGYDLFTSTRDDIFKSFSSEPINNMLRQRIGKISFEEEFMNNMSFNVGARYFHEKPLGVVSYEPYKTTEVSLGLRYAPNEKFLQIRDSRRILRYGDVELKLDHRIGLKDVLGSDYSYHITEFSAYKRFYFPRNAGYLDFKAMAGKVWTKVPFPLLFIPKGNQSYIYSADDYNLMNFYEFITDNYVAGNVIAEFNWSPFSLIWKKLGIRTRLGGKVLYGPLSDNNNPDVHPELLPFDSGVTALGNTPYMEANIGFSNIFKLFSIDYIRRLSYLDSPNCSKGTVMVGALISF